MNWVQLLMILALGCGAVQSLETTIEAEISTDTPLDPRSTEKMKENEIFSDKPTTQEMVTKRKQCYISEQECKSVTNCPSCQALVFYHDGKGCGKCGCFPTAPSCQTFKPCRTCFANQRNKLIYSEVGCITECQCVQCNQSCSNCKKNKKDSSEVDAFGCRICKCDDKKHDKKDDKKNNKKNDKKKNKKCDKKRN